LTYGAVNPCRARSEPGISRSLGFMGAVLAMFVIGGLFAAIMAVLAWLGSRVRRRGGGGSEAFMGPFEEMWHPAAHRARLVTETVEERMVPMPSADDQLKTLPQHRPS
jgi:hypothetical protein